MPKHEIDSDAVVLWARGQWAAILPSLAGLSPDVFNGNHQPCPKCGGTDRFRFTNVDGRGACLCNQCFNNRNGDGVSATRWLTGWSFAESIARICAFLGREVPYVTETGGGKKSSPESQLEFPAAQHDGLDIFIQQLCWKKPGLTIEAVKAAGGKVATFKNRKFRCTAVVLPVFTAEDIAQKNAVETWTPCGYVVWNSELEIEGNPRAGMLPQFDRMSGEVVEWAKMKTTQGSKGGLMLLHGLERLSPAASLGKRKQIERVFKVGGPCDGLALWSIMTPEERETNVIVTNSGGERENVKPIVAELFRGLKTFIVHDCDRPGEAGARKWLAALYGIAAAGLRKAKWSSPIAEQHGADLRDFINEKVSA